MCFDGLYENTLNETIEKYSLRNIDMKIKNFTFPIKKQKNINLEEDQDQFNKYIGGFRSKIESFFAHLGSTFKRFNGESNVRVTKLKTYNIQLRLACVLLNIKKFSELSNLDLMQKHYLWTHNNFDHPDNKKIVPKSEPVKFKFNSMYEMKNLQEDLINSMMYNIEITDEEINIDDDMIDIENSYEVQYIIKHRIDENSNKEYFVKWKKYGKKYNSWVKELDFNETDLINNYNATLIQ